MICRACSSLVDDIVASPNIEPRKGSAKPDMLLLHYTGMHSCARAIYWLGTPQSRVSCHYVIDLDGRITQMVAESERAWHAGAGSWGGEGDVNSRSIGIEIHNPGHDLGYPDFPDAQMRAVEALSLDIVRRWRIAAPRVLAHSDIAPSRKIDPGEKFDWARLARSGVGHWVEPVPVTATDPGLGPGASAAAVGQAQALLARYGYGLEASGTLDPGTATVIAAFQRHFRPARVDGRLDGSTLATLRKLMDALPTADVA